MKECFFRMIFKVKSCLLELFEIRSSGIIENIFLGFIFMFMYGRVRKIKNGMFND